MENTDALFEQLDQLVIQLSAVKNRITAIQHDMKQVDKNMKKHLKDIKREAVQKKVKSVRQPSGFAKPCKVTKELCVFMNKDEGTEIARTDVTRALVSYIKQHKLENESNSKIISPDEKLKSLLQLKDGEELTYFTIQKHMNHHFAKTLTHEKIESV